MRKIIVTEWKNTTIINKNVVEEIKKLKEQSGQNILVAGSGKLVTSVSRGVSSQHSRSVERTLPRAQVYG